VTPSRSKVKVKKNFTLEVHGVIHQNEATASLMSTMLLAMTSTVTFDLKKDKYVKIKVMHVGSCRRGTWRHGRVHGAMEGYMVPWSGTWCHGGVYGVMEGY